VTVEVIDSPLRESQARKGDRPVILVDSKKPKELRGELREVGLEIPDGVLLAPPNDDQAKQVKTDSEDGIESVFRKAGAVWTLSFQGKTIYLPDRVGLGSILFT
jgi:hypothetical protein